MINKQTSHLLINEPPLQLLPSLAVAVGINAAIFIQQLHYWIIRSPNERDGRKWVYNTYKQWHEDNFPFWSERTIERIIADCENRKIVVSGVYNKMSTDRTKWYTIDYNELDKLANTIVTSWQDADSQSGAMLPEITVPETTQKKSVSMSYEPSFDPSIKPLVVMWTDEVRTIPPGQIDLDRLKFAVEQFGVVEVRNSMIVARERRDSGKLRNVTVSYLLGILRNGGGKDAPKPANGNVAGQSQPPQRIATNENEPSVEETRRTLEEFRKGSVQ